MGYLLNSALVAYELERQHGIASKGTPNLDDFHACIKKDVPEGHTFKGFPIHFNHVNTKRIVTALRKDKLSTDIMECTGDVVRFGIRVKIVSYPEDVLSVWLMICVKYRSVQQ